MEKIKTIILKEWAEVFRNRLVIFTVAFLPLIMTALPLGILYSMRGSGAATGLDSSMTPEVMKAVCTGGLTGMACFQAYLVSEFMMLFMLVPVAIPSTIAAYSIVGEKTTRSLEPLLATPITTLELLVGKCLAAAIPAIVATYAAFGLFAAGSWIIVDNPLLTAAFLAPRWLIAIFLVGPLLAILAVSFAMMVSSRVSDPRSAEQISMMLILPIMGGFLGQMAGLFVLSTAIISTVAGVMVLLDALMIYLAARVFQRESILTRWK